MAKETRIQMPKPAPEPVEPPSLEDQLIQQVEDMDTPEPVQDAGEDASAGKEENPFRAELPKMAAQANLDLPAINEGQSQTIPSGLPQMMTTTNVVKKSEFVPMFQNDPDVDPVALHQKRVKRFGLDYVVVNKGKHQQVFTKLAWNSLKGSKFGWVEAVPVPPEVRAIQ